MKKYLIILLTILLTACGLKHTQNNFINTDCNIPIIECVLGTDTVDMIVDTGAEYSIIDASYYHNNKDNFRLINSIETQFSGIGGISTQISSIVLSKTSLGYITFVELNLTQVINSLLQHNIVGLIGSDFLKSHNYIIDYKMRKIYPFEQLDSIYGKSNN